MVFHRRRWLIVALSTTQGHVIQQAGQQQSRISVIHATCEELLSAVRGAEAVDA